MKISIQVEKAKHPLTCRLCNVYTLTANVNNSEVSYSYYGYPKRKALSEFNKLIKSKA